MGYLPAYVTLVKSLSMRDPENLEEAQQIVGKHTENARLRAVEHYKRIVFFLENTKGR